jgi:hypothetical protein
MGAVAHLPRNIHRPIPNHLIGDVHTVLCLQILGIWNPHPPLRLQPAPDPRLDDFYCIPGVFTTLLQLVSAGLRVSAGSARSMCRIAGALACKSSVMGDAYPEGVALFVREAVDRAAGGCMKPLSSEGP